jgi:hypothetical protein
MSLKRGCMVPTDWESPCWLGEPVYRPAGNLAACRNGILNLDTRELQPPNPPYRWLTHSGVQAGYGFIKLDDGRPYLFVKRVTFKGSIEGSEKCASTPPRMGASKEPFALAHHVKAAVRSLSNGSVKSNRRRDRAARSRMTHNGPQSRGCTNSIGVSSGPSPLRTSQRGWGVQ